MVLCIVYSNCVSDWPVICVVKWWEQELVAGGVSLTNWGRSWQCQAPSTTSPSHLCVLPALLLRAHHPPPSSLLPPPACKQSITLQWTQPWVAFAFCHLRFNCSRSKRSGTDRICLRLGIIIDVNQEWSCWWWLWSSRVVCITHDGGDGGDLNTWPIVGE